MCNVSTCVGTRELGVWLTRLAMRERALELRVRSMAAALAEHVANPLQDTVDDWRRTLAAIEKDYTRGMLAHISPPPHPTSLLPSPPDFHSPHPISPPHLPTPPHPLLRRCNRTWPSVLRIYHLLSTIIVLTANRTLLFLCY